MAAPIGSLAARLRHSRCPPLTPRRQRSRKIPADISVPDIALANPEACRRDPRRLWRQSARTRAALRPQPGADRGGGVAGEPLARRRGLARRRARARPADAGHRPTIWASTPTIRSPISKAARATCASSSTGSTATSKRRSPPTTPAPAGSRRANGIRASAKPSTTSSAIMGRLVRPFRGVPNETCARFPVSSPACRSRPSRRRARLQAQNDPAGSGPIVAGARLDAGDAARQRRHRGRGDGGRRGRLHDADRAG